MTLVRGDWFYLLLVLVDSFFMVRPYLYCIQQDNYRVGEIFKSKHLKVVFIIDIIAITIFIVIWVLLYFLQAREFWGFATTMFFFITEFALYFMEDLPDKKKPLRYTKRAVRCMFAVCACSVGAVACAMAVCNVRLHDVYLRYLIFYAFPIVFPLLFIAATSFINIFERVNNFGYERRAKKQLDKNPELIKIAITGSYGKTSVKNMLAEMLKTKYNVLATPASYNTPMGIVKTVKNLDATHEVFIAEMGARRTGDIKRLMRIVGPEYSILTGINSQHLETFKSQENILKEKSRVVTMLKGNGFCVATDKLREIFDSSIGKRQPRLPVYAGFDERSEVRAANVSVSDEGSAFDLTIDGQTYLAVTPLLGRHNIENITLAAAVAYGLGVNADDILFAISSLSPTPHRMQLIQGNGIKIIDDSFNSNPDGARCSLEVLDMFSGRKIVLTPGLVELGRKEDEENFRLGEEIALRADLVMLIGKKRAETIKRGILSRGFDGEIHIYRTLCDAENDFANRLHLGDVLLLLNDLPDIYDE